MMIDTLFNKANKLFSSHKYFEALKIYEKIWIKFPKNIRLHTEINKKIKKYKKEIVQSYSQEEIEKFFRLEKLGQITTVIDTLNESLKNSPNDILTISLLGNFYYFIKNYEKALFFQKIAIQRAPLEEAFYLNISETLEKKGEWDGALKSLHIAKILSLKNLNIDFKIAKLLTKMKNFARADLVYSNLIKDKNLHKSVVYSYCYNLIKYKKEEQAIQFIKNHEKTQKDDYKIKLLLGLAYFNQRNFNEAIKNFLLANHFNPNNTDALNMLGNSYDSLGNIRKAEQYYHEALKINANDKMTLNNLAALSFYQGNLVTAEKLYMEASKKIENNFEALYSLSLCQLAQLKFNEGWKNYKYRWLAKRFNSEKLATILPEFNLSTDKAILLVWGEQGLGDHILFLRFLEDLEPFINDLYIKIDKRLHEIIKRNFPKIKFIDAVDDILKSKINSQIAVCDLGSLFVKDYTDLKNIPKKYIYSDTTLTNKLKNIIKNEHKKKLICGLSWTSKNDDIGENKSISLETLKPILELENLIFIDLQYTDAKDERVKFVNYHGFPIYKIEEVDNFNDINGVVSLVDLCDFIITVSNTNAHIAGALGKKTFLLLPTGKGRLWYWHLSENNSTWYPSIEIIEQNYPGQWEPVINKLVGKVEGYLSERSS